MHGGRSLTFLSFEIIGLALAIFVFPRQERTRPDFLNRVRPLSAGMMAVIPQGAWHRFRSADGVTLMTATLQPSELIQRDVDDPRKVEPQPV
jgi:hypothetical protein